MEEDMDEGQTQKGKKVFLCMLVKIFLSKSDMGILSVCQQCLCRDKCTNVSLSLSEWKSSCLW